MCLGDGKNHKCNMPKTAVWETLLKHKHESRQENDVPEGGARQSGRGEAGTTQGVTCIARLTLLG